MGIVHYLRKAFTSPWNLLIFFGSGVAAVLPLARCLAAVDRRR